VLYLQLVLRPALLFWFGKCTVVFNGNHYLHVDKFTWPFSPMICNHPLAFVGICYSRHKKSAEGKSSVLTPSVATYLSHSLPVANRVSSWDLTVLARNRITIVSTRSNRSNSFVVLNVPLKIL
jgi:hypothetical protein